MPKLTYFVQECPTCGRRLEVRVEYLGKAVNCQHCGGQFVASDPANAGAPLVETTEDVLRRAEQLLQMTAPPVEAKPTKPAEAI